MRDISAVLLPVLFVAVLALVIFGSLYASSQAQRHTFERLAKRFRGRVESQSIFSSSQLRLLHGTAVAIVSYTSHGKNQRHTHFQIGWPERNLRLEIYPQDVLSTLRRLWGMEDILIGSAQFDADFFISGNDRATIRATLNADVQQRIYALAKLSFGSFFSHNNLHLSISGGVLKITKPTCLSTYQDLERFITICTELFDEAQLTRSTGIEFLSDSPVPAPDAIAPHCQICGDTLASDIVFCRRCRTPHHRECWQYLGSCSVYACAEKQFVERRTKRRKRS